MLPAFKTSLWWAICHRKSLRSSNSGSAEFLKSPWSSPKHPECNLDREAPSPQSIVSLLGHIIACPHPGSLAFSEGFICCLIVPFKFNVPVVVAASLPQQFTNNAQSSAPSALKPTVSLLLTNSEPQV